MPTEAVIDATKIIEDYRRFFASFWPGVFRISANNLPLLSLCPSLTVEMTKIPKIPGLFHYLFCWNLRNLPAESTSEMLVASFTGLRAPQMHHFSAPAPPAAGDTTTTDVSATETPTAPPPPPFHVPADAEDTAPAASSSPGVALGTANGVTTIATSEVTDVTADESVVTADGAADDAHASASAYTTDMGVGMVATSSATAARKRKGRSKQTRVAQNARKRQRVAALPLTTQGNTEVGT